MMTLVYMLLIHNRTYSSPPKKLALAVLLHMLLLHIYYDRFPAKIRYPSTRYLENLDLIVVHCCSGRYVLETCFWEAAAQ